LNPPAAQPEKHDGKAGSHPEFNTAELIKPPRKLDWRIMAPIWILLITLLVVGYYRHWDARVVGGGALIIAILSNALAWLVALVAMVPLVGPLIVKILALPFIWLLNAIGYFVAMLAMRRGYTKDVLTYRGLTVALLIGIVIGYVAGHFV
jgi:hypothetical protein